MVPASDANPPLRARLVRALTSLPARAAVTVALLALLSVVVDWSTVERRLHDGRPGWLAAAVATFVIGLLAGAWRWHLLLIAAELPAQWSRTIRAYFMGAFANNFLPTGFGGDAVRALAVGRSGPDLARGATTVVVDRLTALACVVGVAWIALALDAGSVPVELVVGLGLVTAAAVAGVLLVRAAARTAAVRRIIPAPARPVLSEARGALGLLVADHGVTVRVTALGLVYQALAAISVWCGAKAIGLDLPVALVAVTLPLVLIATLVPISLAGFGIREGGYAVLLATAGVASADATLLSLITVVTMALASLPGAFMILTGGRRAQAPPAGSPATER